MSNVNEDNASGGMETFSRGSRLGFLGALEASYDATVRASSMYGAQYYAQMEEDDNRRKIHEAGGENVAPLAAGYVTPSSRQFTSINRGLFDPYDDMMKSFADNDTAGQQKIIGDRDEKLKKLKEQFPDAGIKTYDEIFKNVRSKAQAAEYRASLPKTFMGSVGSFVGDAAGQFNPIVNPLNVVTAPIGGVGKQVIGRVISQGAGQAIIQGINEVTGVQDNRRLLGLDYGLAQAAQNIAGAAIGGAAVQGAGEALFKGYKGAQKWWRNDVPHDPAPPAPGPRPGEVPPTGPEVPPAPKYAYDNPLFAQSSNLSRSRVGMARAVDDLDFVTRNLEDWGGAKPWEVPPNTDTARINLSEDTRFDIRDKVGRGGDTVDDIARRIDPETFRIYDKLAEEKAYHREQIYGEKGWAEYKGKEIDEKLSDISDEIDRLEERMDGATKRMSKKYQERVSELLKERDARFQELNAQDTPGMSGTRERLMGADEQMRDLAPAVSRAYARAQKKWEVHETQREKLRQQMRNGEELMLRDTPTPKEDIDYTLPEWEDINKYATPTDPTAPQVAGPAIDRVAATVDNHAKVIDEAIETYRDSVASALSDEKATTVRIGDRDIDLNDTMRWRDENGTERDVTMRELLQETDEDNSILKAVSSCSIK